MGKYATEWTLCHRNYEKSSNFLGNEWRWQCFTIVDLWDTVAVLKGKFIDIIVYIKRLDVYQINDVIVHLKDLDWKNSLNSLNS